MKDDGNITPSGRRITSEPQIQNLPGTPAYELEMAGTWRTWPMSSTKVVPFEATRHMIDAMRAVEDKDGSFAEMFEAAVKASPEMYTKPIYMYQRKGMVSWIVCDFLTMQEFKQKPHLFRTRRLEGMAKALKVWEGSMPESNGKSNYTAILYTDDIMDGITIERSEYPDRVRYEADRVRHLIGQRDERPFILDYDANKHSGYKGPREWFTAEDIKAAWVSGAEAYFGEDGMPSPTPQDAEKYLKSIQE